MAPAQLEPEAWFAIAVIAAGCVFICLGAIAHDLDIEARRQELHRQVRQLRKQYALMSRVG